MTVHGIAREWLHRPMVILLCGRGEYASLLSDDFVNLIHVRSRAELEASLRHPSIDVAIIEEHPWPGDQARDVGLAVRTRGIGTVYAARSPESGAQLLRERMTIDLSAVPLSDRLDNAVWLACCETELMRREVPEWLKRISSSTTPAFMRFIEEDGHLAPSKSTFMYIFDETKDAEGSAPLIAPALPAAAADEAWSESSRSTVAIQPSESFLRSLRRERDRLPRPWRTSTWVVGGVGVASALLALLHFLSR